MGVALIVEFCDHNYIFSKSRILLVQRKSDII